MTSLSRPLSSVQEVAPSAELARGRREPEDARARKSQTVTGYWCARRRPQIRRKVSTLAAIVPSTSNWASETRRIATGGPSWRRTGSIPQGFPTLSCATTRARSSAQREVAPRGFEESSDSNPPRWWSASRYEQFLSSSTLLMKNMRVRLGYESRAHTPQRRKCHPDGSNAYNAQ